MFQIRESVEDRLEGVSEVEQILNAAFGGVLVTETPDIKRSRPSCVSNLPVKFDNGRLGEARSWCKTG